MLKEGWLDLKGGERGSHRAESGWQVYWNYSA